MTRTEFFSVKGGSGCSVTAAIYALRLQGKTLLVDPRGDQPAVLGLPEPSMPVVHMVTDQLDLIVGADDPSDLYPRYDNVIHDTGTDPQIDGVDRRYMVIRPCYLALRRAVILSPKCDGIILISEPGRALTAKDVSRALDCPVVAELYYDPAVARSVDAGLLASRLPASTNPLKGVLV